jgi:hypothetical protein
MSKRKPEDEMYSLINSMEKFVSHLIVDVDVILEEEKEDMLYVPN